MFSVVGNGIEGLEFRYCTRYELKLIPNFLLVCNYASLNALIEETGTDVKSDMEVYWSCL